MKFSIITTVFNAVDDIEKTIKSVLSQNEVDLEYIITDGGSTDGTLDVINQYSQIKLYSEADKGIYDGMNKGIMKSTGDVIGILNAADIYEIGSLKKVREAMMEDLCPDIVHGRMMWTNKKGEKLQVVGSRIKNSPELHTMPVCHPTTFIKKSVYDECGLFDINYKIAADHHLIHKLINKDKSFFFIDEILSIMEAGGASAIHRKSKRDEVLRTIKELDGTNKDIMRTWYEYYLKSVRDLGLKYNFNAIPYLKSIYRFARNLGS